jgi:hypothetical protein
MPVASSAARLISTRGPRMKPSAARSGSRAISPRTSSVASPTVSVSPGAIPKRDRISGSTTTPKRPVLSASASGKAPPSSSTRHRADRDRRPPSPRPAARSPLRAIERAVATVLTVPRSSRNASSAAPISWWTMENWMSPPSSRWPSLPMPRSSAADSEPITAMAPTPSTMQARKMRNPCRPERISRSATRQARRRSASWRVIARWP